MKSSLAESILPLVSMKLYKPFKRTTFKKLHDQLASIFKKSWLDNNFPYLVTILKCSFFVSTR